MRPGPSRDSDPDSESAGLVLARVRGLRLGPLAVCVRVCVALGQARPVVEGASNLKDTGMMKTRKVPLSLRLLVRASRLGASSQDSRVIDGLPRIARSAAPNQCA